MQRTLAFLLVFFFVFPFYNLVSTVHAQAGGWLWGRANTGSGIDAYAVATDTAGNVYGGGINFGGDTAFFGSLFFPFSAVSGSSGSLGNIQAVWIKYSGSGTPLWVAGTSNADAWLYNIATDAAGNLIVFGSFDSPTLTLGTTTLTNAYGSTGDNQYFLAKYSPTGTLLWAKCDGNSVNDAHYLLGAVAVITTGGVTTDAAGNIYITSSFKKPSINIGSYTLTNTDPSGNSNDVFIAKYNSSGVLQWAKSAGGASDDFAYSIAVGNGGNIYITGAFWSSLMTIGSSSIANPYGTGGYVGFGGGGTPLAYIAKFSPTGTPLWAQGAGGSNGAYGIGTVSDAAGHIYMTGGFGDTSITFGSATVTRRYASSVPFLALYLVQFSPSDVVTWSKTIGSMTQGVWGFSIALAACGEVWVSGNYMDDADVDGNTLAVVPGPDPVFIAGYNLSGGVIGYSGLGSGGDDQNGIACDKNGNVFICSDYQPSMAMTVGPDVLPADPFGVELFYIGKYQNIAIGVSDTLYHTTDTTVCNLPAVTLTATAGYTNYLWDNTSTAPTRTVNASGSYWVVCSSTCSIPTTIDTFHVIISPTDTTYGSKDTTACIMGGTLTLSADSNFTSYKWSTGSTASSITISSTGVYWLAEYNGCAFKADTFNITLSPAPEVNLGNDTAICIGKSLRLSSAALAGTSYLWSNGSTDEFIDVSQGGEYTLTVSQNGCSTTDSINVTFLPSPTLALGPDTTVCDEPRVTVSSGNSATVWSNGQTGAEMTVTFPGEYFASVSNQCGTARDSIKITFEHCLILVPSAFSPNNDGKNDVFKVVGLSLEHYQEFSLSIFNRYGQRVFYTNSIDAGWDGSFNGVPQDLGTYFYMVTYSLNGKSHMMKGDLTLVK